MHKDISRQIGQATKWSTVTEVVSKLVSPIVNMILARLLTPEAFGIVATITMVISFAEIFTDAGFQKYIIQHEFESKEELDKNTAVAFWTNLTVSAFICVLIFIFRDTIAEVVGSPGLGRSISIASVLIIIAAFSSIQMARYKRDFDFKTLFFVRIGTSLLPLLVTIPLALILRNYWALLIGTFVKELFGAIVLTLKSQWRPSAYYSFNKLKEMFGFSAWTLLESISIWITSYVGVFIVGNHLNEYYLGLYKTSINTINAYMAIITSALTPVLFAALSRYQNDEQRFRATFYSFQRLTAIFVIPMGIGIFVFHDLVTEILLGSQWSEAGEFIGLWGLTSCVTIVFSHFSSEVYRSKGKPKISLFSQLLHLAFLIPVLLITVKYGFRVLYIGRSLVRLEMVLVAFIIMSAVFKFRVRDMLKNTYPMVCAALIMGAAGYALQQVRSNMLWQIFAVLVCVIVYFTVLLTVFPKIRREIFEMQAVKKIMVKLRLIRRRT